MMMNYLGYIYIGVILLGSNVDSFQKRSRAVELFEDLQELVLRGEAEEDEMVSVPPGTWQKESSTHAAVGNTTLSQRSAEDEAIDPPPRACLTVKVVYNNRWVEAAGKGDKYLALCEANAVMREAEEIFNGRFAYIPCNRLGVAMSFSFFNGEPQHDTSDDATWQAGENNLQNTALQRHIDHYSNRINHHVFLTGNDEEGPIGSSYAETACFQDLSNQKLKVSIAEWDTHNRITGRIVAHHIAHALGIKLDYTKAPNEPPGFKGFSDRYDSQGNSCTNISGLMDQGYKTEVDKFTTCSKEDYKAYYNKVRQTHRSFCLDCTHDDPVIRCQKLIDYEHTPTRGNNVGKIPVLYKDFQIKFQIRANAKSSNSRCWQVLHLTTGSDNSNYGDRIPAVYLTRLYHGGSYTTHNKLDIDFSLNGQTNFRKGFVVPQNVWFDVRLSQKKVADEYVFEYRVGSQTETLTNSQPADFQNVFAYASDSYTYTLSQYGTSYGSVQIRDFEVCTRG